MSAFSNIVEAIREFNIPHAPNVYEGKKSDRWITYNYADDRGALYCDDEPAERHVSMQVHLYLPARENFISIRERVRESLWRHGAETYPAVTDLGADAIGKRHLVFEFEAIEERTEADGL